MDIGDWLRSLGLDQYEATFREHDIDAEVLPELTEADLERLGVSLGHRKRLLKAIRALQTEEPARELAAQPMTPPVPDPSHLAERRQLTVMFCDLVGSTALSARLDPEDLREVIGTYHQAVAETVRRFDGFVAKYMGDGVLAYFGYPRAHEDDAERAVRAGLDVVAAVGQLKTRFGGRLEVRIGIATGLVVVGDLIGEGASQERSVAGETPNLAARLQALAQPGTVVVPGSTRRLLGNVFRLRGLGRHELKGLPEPVEAWAVEGILGSESRFEQVRAARLTEFVGRKAELGLLMDRWDLAQGGEGQVVLLSGEPGIGKSRIMRELRARLEAEGARSLRFQCSPYHVNSALYPIIDNFERALQFAPDESPERRLDKLEALMVTGYGRPRGDVRFVAALLSLPHETRYGALAVTPQRFKDETLRTLVDTVAAIARQSPTALLFEDAHWADPTTLETMDRLIQRARTIPLLVVVTHRPEFPPRWSQQDHVTALSLGRLTRPQSAAMVSRLAGGKALPADLLEQILDKADGVPLFVEELTKSILESAALRDAGDRWEYAGTAGALTIPLTLRDSLMARLDRVAPVREIAQIGAAIGRAFGYALIAAVAARAKPELDQALAQLAASGLAFQQGTPPDAAYTFKHALVRDAAYDSLLKPRRQELHGKIARAIEACSPDTEATEPELLAHHYTEAKQPEKAVPLWQKAASLALGRMALVEAIAHLTRGLELLADLPGGVERRRRELGLQLALGQASLAAKGFAAPDTGRAYARAHELCHEVGDNAPEFFPALYGRFIAHFQRGELAVAHEAAQELLRLAEDRGDAAAQVAGHRIVGSALCHLGRFVESRVHLEAALALYEPERDHSSAFVYALDSRVACLLWLVHVLLALGYPEQAQARMREAIAYARALSHPYTLAQALGVACLFHGRHRPGSEARTEADTLVAFAAEQGFPLPAAVGTVVAGWVLTGEPGTIEEGIARMRRGLVEYMATGAELWVPDFLALLAQAQGRAGRPATGLELLAEALDRVAATGSHWIEAELHRLRGELLLPGSRDPSAAAACFRRAIAIAREQEAKTWELRAATALARLWWNQGRRAEAHDLLAPTFGGFAEGFGTEDLKGAKALLNQLEAGTKQLNAVLRGVVQKVPFPGNTGNR